MDERIAEVASSKNPFEANEEWKEIRRGWYLGEQDFKVEVLDRMGSVVEGKRRDSFSGEGIRMHDEHEAEAIVKVSCFGDWRSRSGPASAGRSSQEGNGLKSA